jgi:low affinity Fe/Cu permease
MPQPHLEFKLRMSPMNEWFRRFSGRVSQLMGTHWAFATALMVVAVWALTGPTFRFSDTWQIIINTGTTIVTFLMVFILQATQNRDAAAIHMKLDELILAVARARNSFAALEQASEEEVERLKELQSRTPHRRDPHSPVQKS